jgi:PAS domain S-box-containing protein
MNRRFAKLEKLETEHKLTIKILQASENKYRELLENLPQKIFHKDKNSVYVSCNNNYARDLKIHPDEIIGKTDYDFYTKELAEKYRADDKRIMESGKTEYIEEKYIQNGQEVFVQTAKTPLKDEKGNTIGILGIFWDITERKQIEEALRQSERQFKSTFENAAVGMAHVGLDGRLLRVNDTFCKITGYPPEELVTKTFQEITHPEDLAADVAQAQELAEGRIPDYSMEKRYFRKDGSIVWVNLTVSVQRDHTGQPTHFIAVVENVSARKQIEEALKESEEHYRTIIEFSNDLIWILDIEGHYQFVNKDIEEFSGLKQNYFLGKSFTPFIDKQDLPRIIDIFHKTLNGEPQQYEVSVKKEDGSNFFLSVNTAPIYSKGNVVGTVSFGRDITERKKAEEQIKESLKQKLRKSDKQRKLLCHLIEGTRGGRTRALILRHLTEKSCNAHQLAKALNMDYKTIRHHLKVLLKKGMITRGQDEYSGLYFIAKNIESDLDEMDI